MADWQLAGIAVIIVAAVAGVILERRRLRKRVAPAPASPPADDSALAVLKDLVSSHVRLQRAVRGTLQHDEAAVDHDAAWWRAQQFVAGPSEPARVALRRCWEHPGYDSADCPQCARRSLQRAGATPQPLAQVALGRRNGDLS